jgi:hypothetical protein
MALEACRECGKEVSSEAPKCPYCGALNPTPTQQRAIKRGLTLGMLGCAIPLLAFLGFCVYVSNNLFEPANSTGVAAASTRVTPERFAAVAAALEATPGVTVDALDSAAPTTMRIHIDRLDVPLLQARQIANMAYERLGDNAIVRVYDRSGLLLARATARGVE